MCPGAVPPNDPLPVALCVQDPPGSAVRSYRQTLHAHTSMSHKHAYKQPVAPPLPCDLPTLPNPDQPHTAWQQLQSCSHPEARLLPRCCSPTRAARRAPSRHQHTPHKLTPAHSNPHAPPRDLPLAGAHTERACSTARGRRRSRGPRDSQQAAAG